MATYYAPDPTSSLKWSVELNTDSISRPFSLPIRGLRWCCAPYAGEKTHGRARTLRTHPRSVHASGRRVQRRSHDHERAGIEDDRGGRPAGSGRHGSGCGLWRRNYCLCLCTICQACDRHRHDTRDAGPIAPTRRSEEACQHQLEARRRDDAAVFRCFFFDRRYPFLIPPFPGSACGLEGNDAGVRSRRTHRRGRHVLLRRPGQGGAMEQA